MQPCTPNLPLVNGPMRTDQRQGLADGSLHACDKMSSLCLASGEAQTGTVLQVEGMREDRTRSMYDSMEQLPDLPTEEELEEGIRAVQAAVAAAEHEEALRQKSSLPVQEAHPRSGLQSFTCVLP